VILFTAFKQLLICKIIFVENAFRKMLVKLEDEKKSLENDNASMKVINAELRQTVYIISDYKYNNIEI